MKLDFHIHTDISPCSNMSLETAVEHALNNGLRGIAICNHNVIFSLNGKTELENRFNITINPKEPVENPFYIISGVELSLSGTHILGLFVEDEITCPEDIVSNGGVVVLAHPFQHSKDYEKRSKELEAFIPWSPLVETASGRANYKNKSACIEAENFAKTHSLKTCAGSDAHFPEEIGNAYSEIADVVGIEAIKNELLSGRVKFFAKNTKRVFVAKSQISKHGYNFKTLAFYIYSLVRDFGDAICQK